MLKVTRAQILAFRRRTGSLDRRLPAGKLSLQRAAWAGLQDSMPRAALLSIHARVEGATHTAWEDPSLVQVWGPRYQVTSSPRPTTRCSRSRGCRRRARCARSRGARRPLEAALGGGSHARPRRRAAMGGTGPSLRYATLTGRLAIRWEGARAPHVWIVPPPTISERVARRELARRYLHIYGPSTAAAFAKWAGIGAKEAAQTFDELGAELVPVRTPSGDAHLLDADEAMIRAPRGPEAPARLLPSGDAYMAAHDERGARAPRSRREAARRALDAARLAGGSPGRRRHRRRVAPRQAGLSRSRPGSGSRARHGKRSSPRPRRCRCPTPGQLWSTGPAAKHVSSLPEPTRNGETVQLQEVGSCSGSIIV